MKEEKQYVTCTKDLHVLGVKEPRFTAGQKYLVVENGEDEMVLVNNIGNHHTITSDAFTNQQGEEGWAKYFIRENDSTEEEIPEPQFPEINFDNVESDINPKRNRYLTAVAKVVVVYVIAALTIAALIIYFI